MASISETPDNSYSHIPRIAYTLTATDHHAVFSRQRVDVFKDDDVASTESARPRPPRHIFRAGHDAAALVVEADQRQMDAHLRTDWSSWQSDSLG